MVTNDVVYEALKQCYDPEIPVNIVDLGLVYDVRIEPTAVPGSSDQDVEIDMTLTSQGCPMHGMITDQVRNRLLSIPGVKDATVNIVWFPAWTPHLMSDSAKKQLGIDQP